MTNKNTKTIVFAALIAAMILPFSGMQSAEASNHGENLTIEELQAIVSTSATRIAHYEARLLSSELIYDHRIESINAHQLALDALDAIVDSGGVLTDTQIVFYDDIVAEIIWLESKNVGTANDILTNLAGIARHQAVMDWAQAEIDSRSAW